MHTLVSVPTNIFNAEKDATAIKGADHSLLAIIAEIHGCDEPGLLLS
jgi:hypothetical protein